MVLSCWSDKVDCALEFWDRVCAEFLPHHHETAALKEACASADLPGVLPGGSWGVPSGGGIWGKYIARLIRRYMVGNLH